MKVLCVAEKPSIAKSITQILSGGQSDNREGKHKYCRNYDFSYNLPPPLGRNGDADFTVTAVLGHLTTSDFDDDHRRWGSCEPFALFDAPIITTVSQDLKKVEQNLQVEARNANLLIIWTDCDREGEHIGSEVAAVCRKVNRNIIVKRARFSAIIPAQIHQACRQANDLDLRQADAVEARIHLDLRIGAAFTRLMTMSLQNRVPEIAEQVVSYGPCQFPTLGFVVDQYNRVQSFVPETFWYIYVAIERQNDGDDVEEGEGDESRLVEFKWKRNHLFDMDIVLALYEQCVEKPIARVIKVETKPTTKWKPLPLTTVELQQSGSRLLHMTPKRVLDIAEKLYQKGCLSYPRTETDQYDKDFDFNSLIQKQTFDGTWGAFAQKLIDGEFQRPRNGKKNDKAHPPIHPTAHAGNLDADERRVFELVTRRFLASCHKNAEGKTTTVEIQLGEELFSTSGLVIIRRNYLEVYPYDKWSSNALPDFQEGEQFQPSVCETREGTTSKPNLLTEADLVGLMDKNGIGTDATIAEHIAKIIERGYVTEKQEQKIKYLLPSLLGVGLVEGYNQIGFDRSLSKPHLRRETEHRMQLICDGNETKRAVLDRTIEEYKEVFVKAKREFGTVIDSVENYLHGAGAAQDALRAAARGGRGGRGARGARGGRGAGPGRGGGGGGAGRGRRNNDEDDDDANDDDDGGDGGPPRGGGAVRRGGAPATRGKKAAGTRGRGGRTAAESRDDKSAPKRKRKTDESNADGTGDCQCNCQESAVLRTVQKADSPHKGRQFWACAKPQGDEANCKFFQWEDEEPPARAGPSRNASRAQPPPAPKKAKPDPPVRREIPAIFGDDGQMRCNCGLEAAHSVVGKDGPNKGRAFWACPNNPKARCGFFEWDEGGDDGGAHGGYEGGTSKRSGSGSNRAAGNQNAAGGASSSGCFKCGESGHWSNACPNDGAGPSRSGGRGGGTSRSAGSRDGGSRGAGGDGQSCFKCGETGHWANACPNEGNDRAGPSRGYSNAGPSTTTGECYKCNRNGHWAKDCPNGDESNATCFRCGDEGHWAGGCRLPPGSDGSLGNFGGGNPCFRCGSERHWAGQCTLPAGSDDTFDQSGLEQPCFRCGKTGHWSGECTLPFRSDDASGEKACFRCGSAKHWAGECTLPAGADGGWGAFGSTQICKKCLKPGHWAGMCRSDVEMGGGTTEPCYCCKQTGHFAANCPYNMLTKGTDRGKVTMVSKDRMIADSLASGLPTMRRAGPPAEGSGGGGGAPSWQNPCFRCKRPGHFASECPFDRMLVSTGGSAMLWPSASRMGWEGENSRR